MLQMINLPDWLPWWVPLVLLVPTLLWALSFLFMPFSVFGVKSRLEVIEARLDEVQNEIRHLALRLPVGGASGPDYDDVFPPRSQEPRAADRIMTRPPIPPARHDLYDTRSVMPAPAPQPVPAPAQRLASPAEPRVEPRGEGPEGTSREPALEDRPPPPPNARPARRSESAARPVRAEPRLDWRR
jgi:hypothetical protein